MYCYCRWLFKRRYIKNSFDKILKSEHLLLTVSNILKSVFQLWLIVITVTLSVRRWYGLV